MKNYCDNILGTLMVSTFTGARSLRTGRIVSYASLKARPQMGVITFGTDDEATQKSKIEDALTAGYDVLVSPAGDYASLYAPAPVGKK